jgi:predicted DNA-binding transcriptional regulator AlpA
MELRLFSLDNLPPSLPIWQAILDDLGCPPVHRIARTLGVSERTVYRWNRAGQAPRMALLALFWLTRWGRSEVDTRATNDAILAVSYLRSLSDRVRQLEGELQRVLALSATGAANSPILRAPGHG